MILVLLLQCGIVVSLIMAARRSLENALPVFCFFLVLMPLEAKLVIPGMFDVNIMRVSLGTLLLLYWTKGRGGNASALPLKGAMAMHILWALCSTAYSLSVATSIKQLLAQVLEFYLMYFLLVRIVTRRDTLERILYAMIAAMGICCVLSVFEVYAHYSILRVFPASNWITYNGGLDPLYSELGRGLRVRSTFPHPILFGDALAMSIPVALYLISVSQRAGQRRLLWVILVLMFWSLYKTQSRGPWLATGICCVFLFFLVKRKVRRYLITLAVITLLALLARPGVWQSIEALYVASTDPNQPVGTSYLYRHALTDTVISAVNREPSRALLGYGLGTFRTLGLEITFLGTTRLWFTCDDNWALFLYETGYVGLALIGLLLFRALWIALRDYFRLPRPDNALSGVLFIALAGFCFLMKSVAAYSWGQQGYMSWIFISIAVSHGSLARMQAVRLESDAANEEDASADEAEPAVLVLQGGRR